MIVAGHETPSELLGEMVRLRTLLATVRGPRYSHEHVFAPNIAVGHKHRRRTHAAHRAVD
jgi:hypothetical protein